MDQTFNLLCGSANLTGVFIKTLTFEYTGNTYVLPLEWDVTTDNDRLTINHTEIHTESDIYKVDQDLPSLSLSVNHNHGYILPNTMETIRLLTSMEVDILKVYPQEDDEDDEVTINHEYLYILLDKMKNYLEKELIPSDR